MMTTDGRDLIKEAEANDVDKPSLVPFFLMEFAKYGGLLFVLYIIYSFLEPYLDELKGYWQILVGS